MRDWIKLNKRLKQECKENDNWNVEEHEKCIEDLLGHEEVQSMKCFTQHGKVSCFDHCMNVSYKSYKICKKLNWDSRSAARGGMLHDFFLYDWHTTKIETGLHGFQHPYLALENACHFFLLTDMEKDIIVKHMWPLTHKLPKYRESYVVAFVDKYCALLESLSV